MSVQEVAELRKRIEKLESVVKYLEGMFDHTVVSVEKDGDYFPKDTVEDIQYFKSQWIDTLKCPACGSSGEFAVHEKPVLIFDRSREFTSFILASCWKCRFSFLSLLSQCSFPGLDEEEKRRVRPRSGSTSL